MALTKKEHISDGTTTQYDVSFNLGYLRKDFVYVYTGDVPQDQLDYTWVDDYRIQLSEPLPTDTVFYIQRIVDRADLVNKYTDGAIMYADNMDDSFLQALMILQEIEDGYIQQAGDFVIDSDLDMLQHRIKNCVEITGLIDATLSDAAVPLSQMEKLFAESEAAFMQVGSGIGRYEADLTLEDYSQFVTYGESPRLSQWKVALHIGLPYTIDSTTYPNPEDDPNIVIFSGGTGGRAEVWVDAYKQAADPDDTLAIERAFNDAPDGHKIIFTPGKTYSVSEQVRIDNNSDKTGVTRSFHVVAHGSKIRKNDFTGSAFLEIYHNPSDEWYQNRYENDEWDFLWEGGEQDANGFNQNFRMAANIRDGLGTIDTNKFTTPEQQAKALEYQGLQSEVFGNPELPWYVNPAATNTPHAGQDWVWLSVSGAANVTFRDIVTRNRHEEGLVAQCCRNVTFDNCHDYNGLPTNDQFQIHYVGGGDFVNGQQHFHMRSTNGQTLMRLVVTDSSVVSVGQEVTSDTSAVEWDEITRGTVDHIIGNQLFLKYVSFGDGFIPGATLQVTGQGNTSATIVSYNILEAPVMNVINCSSNTGNSGIGYMNTEYCPTFSALNVTNYVANDLCLIGIRSEHVHSLNVTNMTAANGNAFSDPTGTLDYIDQAAIEVGASTRVAVVDGVQLTNITLSGNNYSRQRVQALGKIVINFPEGNGRIHAVTLEPAKRDAIQGLLGDVSNPNIKSEPYLNYPDHYPIDNAIKSHRGKVSNPIINGCMSAITQCEDIDGGTIENVKGTAITGAWTENVSRSMTVQNLRVNNVGSFMVAPGGSDGTEIATVRVSNNMIENVQGYVILSTHETTALEVRGNTFKNWGLDTSLSNDDAGLICYNQGGGGQARELYLLDNTFRADHPDARKTLWIMNTSNTTLIERGSVYANSNPSDWFIWRGGSVIKSRELNNLSVLANGQGAVVEDLQGNSLGACEFKGVRSAFRYTSSPSVANLQLLADDDVTPGIPCVTGDVWSMTADLAPADTVQNILSGATFSVYIAADNTLVIFGSATVKLQGNSITNGTDITSYLTGDPTNVEITLTGNTTITQLGTAASGISEQCLFAIYNVFYTSAVNDNRYYPFNDNEDMIHDITSGHHATLAYPYLGEWIFIWS